MARKNSAFTTSIIVYTSPINGPMNWKNALNFSMKPDKNIYFTGLLLNIKCGDINKMIFKLQISSKKYHFLYIFMSNFLFMTR